MPPRGSRPRSGLVRSVDGQNLDLRLSVRSLEKHLVACAVSEHCGADRAEVENGKTKLRLSTFVYITEALQVSADVLLRTNTPEVIGIYQGEFNDLLADCSPAEIDSIIKIVKELKTTMRMKKDDYLF